jgi:cell cycle checkpoint protein
LFLVFFPFLHQVLNQGEGFVMDSAATQEAPELAVRCLLDNVQGLVDALSCIRWKKQQDAICELSEHGMVITVEEWTCLQARVYFRKELFREYQYQAGVRPRFGVSLALLIDCLHTFTSSTGTTALELCYPGPDMQLLLKFVC